MVRLVSFLLLSCCCLSSFGQLYDLRCEYRVQPLGIDKASPAFGWKLQTFQRGVMQTAYRILVGSDSVKLAAGKADVWDSGRELSANSINVTYKGKPLQAATRYYWKVMVWDNEQQEMGWSTINAFTTGLYTKTDWKGASWIGYEDMEDSLRVVPGVHGSGNSLGQKSKQRPVTPLLRKAFSLPGGIKEAYAFISGLGQYELSINGHKVGESILSPGWTYYDKTCLYNVYDITSPLQQGENVAGVLLGNGFYHINRERYRKMVVNFGMPKMICLLKIIYENGKTATIVSDESWTTAPAPIVYNSIYGGEDYDANKEQPGWDKPSFTGTGWKKALLVKPPAGILSAELDYPVTVKEKFAAQTVTQPSPGVYMYDFGQNVSGFVSIQVSGKKGQTVKLTPAELVNDQQLANQKATGSPYFFSYTLKGDGVETWTPKFSYYGFRYVQVEGAVPDTTAGSSGLPRIKTLTSLHTRNSAPANGSFTCSNELFNKINTLILWAIKGNFQSVVTDCPHREKLGWLEQDYLMGAGIQYNFETHNLYNKIIRDMMDAQLQNGMVPDIAPEYVRFDGGFRDSPEWGSAAVILPWLQYKWYGDTAIVREAISMMEHYVGYLKSQADNHILSHGLGDWFDLGPNSPGEAQLTPKGITATAIYYYDVALLSKMEVLIGRKTAGFYYAAMARDIQQAFNKAFFDPQAKVYATGSQTSMAMPLVVGLVEDQYREAVMKNLVDSISASGKQLSAGDVGFHFLVQALQEGGASQLLYEMNYRDDVPGYGYQLKKGATTLTESWAALPQVSNNHLMLGHVMEWFYSGLAGIRQAPQSVAWNEVLIQPEPVGDLTFVKGSYTTLYGTIRSEWKKEGGVFTLKVLIPPNAKATVSLPAAEGKEVTESGNLLRMQKFEKGRGLVEVSGGEYVFVVK